MQRHNCRKWSHLFDKLGMQIRHQHACLSALTKGTEMMKSWELVEVKQITMFPYTHGSLQNDCRII